MYNISSLGKRPFSSTKSQSASKDSKRQKIESIIPNLIPDVVLEIVNKMDYGTLVNFHATCKEAADYTSKRWEHFKTEHGYNYSFGMTRMLSVRDQYIFCHLARNYIKSTVERGAGFEQHPGYWYDAMLKFAANRPNTELKNFPPTNSSKKRKNLNNFAEQHAGECFLKAIEIKGYPAKNHAEAYQLFNQAVFKGMTSASLYIFKKWVTRQQGDPRLEKIVVEAVLTAAEQGDFEALELAIRRDPASYLAHSSNYPPYDGYQGDLCMEKQDYTGAFGFYTRALAMYKTTQPITGYYYGQLALVHHLIDMPIEALEYYEKFTQLASKIPRQFLQFTSNLINRKKEIYYKAAFTLFEEKNYKGALDLYLSCGNPVENQALVHCAYAHFMLRDFKSAIAKCGIVENKELPNELLGLLNTVVQGVNNQFEKANQLVSEGKFKEAIDFYETLRTSFSGGYRKRVEARQIMAFYYAGMNKEALELLYDYIYSPENSLLLFLPSDEESKIKLFFQNKLPEFLDKAKSLMEQGQYVESTQINIAIGNLIEKKFYSSVSKEERPLIFARVAYCLYKQGLFNRAIKIINLLPRSLPEEAVRLLQSMKEDRIFELQYAHNRFEAKKFDIAIVIYEKLKESFADFTNEDQTLMLVHLAYSHYKLRNQNEALEYCHKARKNSIAIDSKLSELLLEIESSKNLK